MVTHELSNYLENKKRQYELELIEKSKSDPKLIFAYINSKQRVKSVIRSMRDMNGEVSTDGKEIVNLLNNYFSSVFVKENENTPKLQKRTENSIENFQISTEDVLLRLEN